MDNSLKVYLVLIKFEEKYEGKKIERKSFFLKKMGSEGK